MLLEKSMGPFIAAGAYVLCALNGYVASATTHSASVNRISGISIGWHRSSLPSFISAKKSSFHWTDNVLFQTRGGSDEEEGATTAVAEAEEGAAVAAANNDDVVTPIDSDNATEAEPRNLTFSATKPYDGSPEDPDGIPSRFLNMKKGDREGAKEAFEGHLAWRKENDVDTVLSRPHPQFDVCKAMAPHYFAGHDVKGNIVFVQRPAMLDFELMRKNNATIDDLLNHYIYVIEYCWNILEDGPPEGVMTNVLDMSGLSFRSIKNQEYIGFGKNFVNMMSSNYPGRSYKTLIVNAPKWFHGLFKLFKPLLREATRKKIVILKSGKHQEKVLREILGDSLPNDLISGKDAPEVEAGARFFLPTEEKEKCEPGPNSLIEFEMRQFCIELLKLNNETLQEVI